MTNLEAAIIAKEAQVKKLLTELEALKKAQAILDGTADATPERPARVKRQATPTLGDRVVQILRDEGAPMHVDSILARMRFLGFEAPAKPTLVSGLLKDRQNRFRALGGNVYELSERPATPTVARTEETSPSQTLFGTGTSEPASNGHQQRFPLLQEVRVAVSEIEGDITQTAVFARLTGKFPEVTTLYPASVASALRRLTEMGELEVTHESIGNAPKVYRKVSEVVMS